MARETKVGLLAGLSFIICFAIILANRRPLGLESVWPAGGDVVASDRQRDLSTASSPSLQASRPEPTYYQVPSAENGQLAGEVGRSPRQAIAPRRYNELLSRQAAAVDRHVSKATNPPRNDQWSTPNADEAGPNDGPGLEVDARSSESMANANESLRTLLDRKAGSQGRAPVRSPRRQSTERAATVPSRPSGRVARDSARQVAKGRLAPAESVREHYTVAVGDTLSKIAQKRYGRKSKRLVDAIFDANRGVLRDPDRIQVGMKLVIPRVESVGLEPRARKTSSKPDPNAAIRNDRGRSALAGRSSRVSPSAGPRWYQIAPNDRYISIAREQLGDASRWREIFELNRDKFSDPQNIRVGVRIRLPANHVADSRGVRR